MGARAWLAWAALLLTLGGCTTPAPEAPPKVPTDAVPEQPAEVLAVVPTDAEVAPAEAGPVNGPWGAGVHEITLEVHGQSAHGLLAVPEGPPVALALVAHGWGGDAAGHRSDLERLADAGAVAVAMDYRGERGAFKVWAGVEDTIAATQALQTAYPGVDRTLLYGWSMGGEIALLVTGQMPPGTFDYVFAGAGVMDLATFWDASPFAHKEIEAEAGGTPTEVPGAYALRSPLSNVGAIAAHGAARVFLVHGSGDPVVPVDQSERMQSALADAGQAVSFYLVTKDRMAGPCLAPTGCLPDLLTLANHDAGAFRLMQPFIDHRIDRLPDPVEAAVRGTYDGDAGTYDPSDVGP